MTNRNIILLTVDCLRYDRCGFTGHHRETTPTLDALARKAHIYDGAYATGMRTAESFPGILAGRLSADAAYYEKTQLKAIPDGAETLASWLFEEGYTTVARVANPQLTSARNFDKGFSDFKNLRTQDESSDDSKRTGGAETHIDLLMKHFRSGLKHWQVKTGTNPMIIPLILYRHYQMRSDWPTVPGERVANALITALEDTEGPLFLWGHFNDIHAPLHPGRIKRTKFIDAADSRLFIWDGHRITQTFEPRYEVMYDAAVRYVDSQINHIIKKLEMIDEWENTLLIVTADHGEALYEREGYGHGAGHDQFVHGEDRHYMYDELLHVPLLVVSEETDCTRISSPTSLGELHQIIAEGANIPEGSFRNCSETVLSKIDDELTISDALTDDGHTIAVRNEDYKYISPCVTDPSEVTASGGTCHHYRSDMGERHDISAECPSELVSAAEAIVTKTHDLEEISGTLDKHTESQLSALGYK